MGPGQAIKLGRFEPGKDLLDQLSADRLNTILSAIEANRPIIGTNMTGQWTTAGTIMRAQPQVAVNTANANEYSFELEIDKIDNVDFTVDVHVGFGEINGTPPDGMTGADDYVLTITEDGTEIWAVITYDTDTLEITSRTLAYGTTIPDSSVDTDTGVGTIIVPIGFVDINVDPDTGHIKEANPHNRHCGDINFAIMYGSVNGQAAFIPVNICGDWTAAFPS